MEEIQRQALEVTCPDAEGMCSCVCVYERQAERERHAESQLGDTWRILGRRDGWTS
ncbi:Hypothetical protein SMAX5B_002048 [Scophthalmus maximus]|uniref:Uncharacterized protein n=1 Tax=Scophthalmus maximus TaxID=52904 RepID=A0A2U9CWM3_SCOMX|nr:Hypothetical protein SMAX5B_002048 [Scophthalmus maximus]